MANRDFSDVSPQKRGRAMAPPATGKRGGKGASFPERPGPAGGLPGSSQRKSRANNVPGGRFYVKKEGL